MSINDDWCRLIKIDEDWLVEILKLYRDTPSFTKEPNTYIFIQRYLCSIEQHLHWRNILHDSKLHNIRCLKGETTTNIKLSFHKVQNYSSTPICTSLYSYFISNKTKKKNNNIVHTFFQNHGFAYTVPMDQDMFSLHERIEPYLSFVVLSLI